ncbi:MAG: Segregation and condensation protein A [Chromatiales bacterium USCg_Taylor]|nr:MAG: Segregation and condensation protein A [Chromatiales bacterium USCg_Taylor]
MMAPDSSAETASGIVLRGARDAPIAMVRGQPVTELPTDLYIPPDALEVFLEAFEGPLDLLLYLIKRQNLDILDIPIAPITEQYLRYIDLMVVVKLELAAEYLVMAAVLAEIKSRMLLPKPAPNEEESTDPRAELMRRLQEYERYKRAAEDLDALPRLERDLYLVTPDIADRQTLQRPLAVDLDTLRRVFFEVLARAQLFSHHHVQREPLSVRERMVMVLDRVAGCEFMEFTQLFSRAEGRMGAVVTFLAILELMKESLIDIVQSEPLAPVYVKAAA